MASPNLAMALSGVSPGQLVVAVLETPRHSLNTFLQNVEPWRIVLGSAGAAVVVSSLYHASQHRVPLSSRIKRTIFRWLRKLPAVQRQIRTEMGKVRENFEGEFGKGVENVAYQLELAPGQSTAEQVLQEAQLHLSLGELDWENGAMSGTVYSSDKELGNYLPVLPGISQSSPETLQASSPLPCTAWRPAPTLSTRTPSPA